MLNFPKDQPCRPCAFSVLQSRTVQSANSGNSILLFKAKYNIVLARGLKKSSSFHRLDFEEFELDGGSDVNKPCDRDVVEIFSGEMATSSSPVFFWLVYF